MVAEYLRTVALEVNNRTKGAHVWRSYQGGSNAWWERQPIFRHLSRITAANGANAAFSDLEALVTAKGSRGISSAPDWEGIVRDLRCRRRRRREVSAKKNRGGGESGGASPWLFPYVLWRKYLFKNPAEL
jgi:hypothetical protein